MLSLDEFEIQQVKDLGEVIAQQRLAQGKTQRQLGVDAEMGQPSITAFETASRDFKFSTFQTLARALGYRLDISLVPIDGGEAVSGRPDPKLRSTRTYDGGKGRKYPNRKPAVRKPRPVKPINPGPQVEYDSDDEFDTERELAAMRERLGVA